MIESIHSLMSRDAGCPADRVSALTHALYDEANAKDCVRISMKDEWKRMPTWKEWKDAQ